MGVDEGYVWRNEEDHVVEKREELQKALDEAAHLEIELHKEFEPWFRQLTVDDVLALMDEEDESDTAPA